MYPQPNAGLLKNTIRGILIAVLFISACGTQKDLLRNTHSVTGVLYITGNEPFTNLAIQTDGGVMVIIRKDTTTIYRELRKLQGQKLRVQFRPDHSSSDTTSFVIERYDLVKIP